METKIIDNRNQKQRIIIDFDKKGYNYNLNNYIDNIITDIKTIISQRDFSDDVSVCITLE